eukprot:472175_1
MPKCRLCWNVWPQDLTHLDTLRSALTKNESLEQIVLDVQTEKLLQRFVLIFDCMDVMSDIMEEPIDLVLAKKVAAILARKNCTRMIWAMLRDKKHEKVC